MAKYHINPETNRSGVCRAKNSCPWKHFESRDDADAVVAKMEKLAAESRGNDGVLTKKLTKEEILRQKAEHATAVSKSLRILEREKAHFQREFKKSGYDLSNENVASCAAKVAEAQKIYDEKSKESKTFLKKYENELKIISSDQAQKAPRGEQVHSSGVASCASGGSRVRRC